MAGWLEDFITDVRLAVDDPSTGARYTDADIVRLSSSASRKVFRDLCALTARPIVVRYEVPIAAQTRRYVLPPSVGEVLNLGRRSTDGDWWEWVHIGQSRWAYGTASIRVENNTLVFDVMPTESFTLTVEFIPSGDFRPHEGARTFLPALLTSTQFALIQPATAATRGFVDDREGAYIGARLRVWKTTPGASEPPEVQERIVTGHVIDSTATNKTRLLTVNVDFSPAITQDEGTGNTSYTYEVVPIWADSMRMLLVYGTAATLATLSGLTERLNLIQKEYQLALRTEKLAEAYASPENRKWYTDTREGVRGGWA